MNKKQYIVLAKKTIRNEWQVIFAIDADVKNAFEYAREEWEKFNGYKCIILESQYGSYISEKEIAK